MSVRRKRPLEEEQETDLGVAGQLGEGGLQQGLEDGAARAAQARIGRGGSAAQQSSQRRRMAAVTTQLAALRRAKEAADKAAPFRILHASRGEVRVSFSPPGAARRAVLCLAVPDDFPQTTPMCFADADMAEVSEDVIEMLNASMTNDLVECCNGMGRILAHHFELPEPAEITVLPEDVGDESDAGSDQGHGDEYGDDDDDEDDYMDDADADDFIDDMLDDDDADEPVKEPEPAKHAASRRPVKPGECLTATDRLLKEYRAIMRIDTKAQGLSAEPDEENLYHWTAKLFGFEKSTGLAKDLAACQEQYGLDHIELSLVFPKEFPHKPPFCRVVKPRFQRSTGFIMDGGAICMEVLTSEGWTAAYSIESLLLQIRTTILVGKARLDLSGQKLQEYDESTARQVFQNVVRHHAKHGWVKKGTS